MGLYARDSLDLLGQLIKRDNPGFKGELNKSTVIVLGGPYTSGLGTSGRNTRIVLNGKTGSGVVGKKEFFYDRLNLGQMFNGITVVFNAKGDSATVADLLPSLNEQYGLGLQATDITNGATKLGTGYSPTPVTLSIASACVAYTGSLSVIWTRSPVGIYPESGPGSKVLLVGSLNEGYFGLVTEAELFSAPDIISKINESGVDPKGTLAPAPAARHWYKFARDKKIFYLANYNHISIVWQDLYVRGCVYEVDEPETKQYPQNGIKHRQKLAIKKIESGRDWYLSPCMPRVTDRGTWEYTASNQPPDPSGDVARLFSKICSSGGFATAEWDVQNVDTSGYWQSTVLSTDTRRAFGAGMTGLNQGTYDTLTFLGGWRPMLELIDVSKIALPIEEFIGQQTGTLRKPLLTLSSVTGDLLLNLADVSWEIQGALKKPLFTSFSHPLQTVKETSWNIPAEARKPLVGISISPPSRVSEVSWHLPLRVPVMRITSEYKLVVKTDLSTANGELDGFK